MGKTRTWIGFVKKLLIPESKSRQEKTPKRWKCAYGRRKLKQNHPVIEEVVPERTLNDAKEEQRQHAVAVAVATAAAAEAAVSAANAAAEVVRLTGLPDELDMRDQNAAAIKIQSIYRAHLARKALRALQGVVRLQAVIQGQLVRRQIINHLRSLQSIAKIHTQAHQIKIPICGDAHKSGEKQQFHSPRKELEKKEEKLERRSFEIWEYELFPKQDKEMIWSQKQETDIKRERMKKYSSHRERRDDQSLEEIITMKADRSHYFEQKGRVKESQMRYPENKKSTIHLVKIEKLKNGHKQHSAEDPLSPSSLRRRLDEASLPNSRVFPSYMAATESAKAKARSISTSKQRLDFLDIYSVQSSSSLKPKLTSWSSFNDYVSSGTSQ